MEKEIQTTIKKEEKKRRSKASNAQRTDIQNGKAQPISSTEQPQVFLEK